MSYLNGKYGELMTNVLFDNVILTDADGCFLYWEHAFASWMYDNGYGKPQSGVYELDRKYNIDKDKVEFLAKMFNESAGLSRIPPMYDAIKYIRKLHEEHGYVFHCISAIQNIQASRDARWENIHRLFGMTAFEKLMLCGDSKNKDELLSQYAGSECFWIEDIPANAEYGLKYGLKPLLMRQHYNEDYKNYSIPKVSNWKEIYEYVVGERTYPA